MRKLCSSPKFKYVKRILYFVIVLFSILPFKFVAFVTTISLVLVHMPLYVCVFSFPLALSSFCFSLSCSRFERIHLTSTRKKFRLFDKFRKDMKINDSVYVMIEINAFRNNFFFCFTFATLTPPDDGCFCAERNWGLREGKGFSRQFFSLLSLVRSAERNE